MQPQQIFDRVWVHGKPAYRYRRTKKFKPSPVFEWRPHQIEQGTKAWNLLSTTGWVYLMHDARTGKTGTALYSLEYHQETLNVLIITTKNGIWGVEKDSVGGWLGFIGETKAHGWLKHSYFITNHHSIKKGTPEGIKPNVVIVDESHKNFSKPHPAESKLWREAKMVIGKCPVIFLSATPHAQTIMQIYWQLALCIYTPFIQAGYDTFDKWFRDFGVAKTKYVGNGVAMPVYDEAKDEDLIESYIKNNFLALRYTDVGGKEELEPVDKRHYVELTGVVKQIYDTYQDKEVIQLNDVVIRTMSAGDVPRRLHQIEGATLKYQDVFAITDPESGVRYRGVKPNEYFFTFPVHDKIAYIKKTWGDTNKIVIMYEYILEGKLLRSEFKHAKILQGTTNAEAIDLWQYDDMIVYSMNWSTSSYIQRRDRQKHLTNRTKPITIHYLLVKGGVSEMVFDTVVTNKEDFTDKYYKIRKNLKLPEYI